MPKRIKQLLTNPTMTAAAVAAQTAQVSAQLSIFQRIREQFRFINESKLMIGVLMILMNVAAKYVDFKFSKTQEQILRNGLAREIIIFAVAFMGTRDILLSVILTASFMLLAQVLFNEKSEYCIIPNHMQKLAALIDVNKDGKISLEEERRAIDILEKAEKQHTNNVNGNFVTYLNANM